MSLLTLILFSALIICCTPTQSDEEPKVIIIGAGAAGLAAATKLLENSVHVTVLEGESRIGGRIHTVHFADGFVELGAQYCTVRNENIVHQMVKDLDLLQSTPMTVDILTTDKRYYENGLIDQTRDIFIDVFKNLDRTTPDAELNNVFNKQFEEAILKNIPDDKPAQDAALSLRENLKSLLSFLAAKDFFIWKKHGYKIFLDVLMKQYPNKTKNFDVPSIIQTGKTVEKIIWGEEKVTVKCKGGEEVKADYVIFTPSLGVLKEKHNELFTPKLPDHKVKAIESMNFEGNAVIYMHFPEAWWPKENFPGYTLLWNDVDKEKINEEFKSGPREDGRSWLVYLTDVNPVEGNPNVLTFWLYGKLVPKIEKMDDQTIIDGFDYLMKKFVPSSIKVAKADKIIKSDWFTNPHFRGGYTFTTEESAKMIDPSSFESLMEPLKKNGNPVVMFAGEATNPQNWSSVPGAVESGWREAKRVLELIEVKKH